MEMNLVKRLPRNLFLKNLLYLCSGEGINRVLKLLPTIILARYLGEVDFGIVAITATVMEFTRVLTFGSGLGTRLLQATDEEEIKQLTNTSYWLSWVLGLGVCILHIPIAFIAASVYHEPKVVLPICLLGLTFVFTPIGQTQLYILMKQNRLGIMAKVNTINTFICAVGSCSLALLHFGYWSIIIPQILASIAWGLQYKHACSWRPTSSFDLTGSSQILKVGSQVLGVELLAKLRANVDYMIIGAFVGVHALGLYYFAFTSGLGISLSAIGAFNSALFPYLCKHKAERGLLKRKFLSTMKHISVIIIPLVIIQSVCAPFYVPIIFGTKWIPAIPIIVLICISAIPRPYGEGAGYLLNALDKVHITLRWNILFTTLFVASLLFVARTGIVAVAATVCIIHWIALPLFTCWTYNYCFRRIKHEDYTSSW